MQITIKKQHIKIFLFSLLILVMSPLANYLGLLPIVWLLIIFAPFHLQQFFDVFLSLLEVLIPLIFLLVGLSYLQKIKRTSILFFIFFLPLLLAYLYGEQFSFSKNHGLIYLIFLYVILISAALTAVWKTMIVQSKKYSFLILLTPFVFDAAIIFSYFSSVFTDPLRNHNDLLTLYIQIGNWLYAVSHHTLNIFYLDFSGFLILVLNSITALFLLLCSFLLRKNYEK